MATLLSKYRAPPAREAATDPAVPRPASEPIDPDDDDRKRDRWWYESSYDLRSGLEVDDDIGRTIPGEILDRLFTGRR